MLGFKIFKKPTTLYRFSHVFKKKNALGITVIV